MAGFCLPQPDNQQLLMGNIHLLYQFMFAWFSQMKKKNFPLLRPKQSMLRISTGVITTEI